MRLSLPSIYASGAPRDLHSFPTRRSSDLRFHLLGLEKLLLQPAPSGFGAALFGHVAKAPDPADRDAIDLAGLGVSLEHSAVEEFQLVEAHCIGRFPELADFGGKALGIAKLPLHRGDELAVVPGGEQLVGDTPELEELPVVPSHRPGIVDPQNPVRGGVESGP